jgi:hypothetical protein
VFSLSALEIIYLEEGMSNNFSQLPSDVQKHVSEITRSSGLPDTDESKELMAEAWLAKKEAFEREIESLEMEEVDLFESDDDRGALVMTYSGSLLNVGPSNETGRSVEYTSIGLRSDVPDSLEIDAAELKSDVTIGNEASFKDGPLSRTSKILKIAVFNEEMNPEEEQEALDAATMVLTQEFAEINKTVVVG